MQAPPSLSEQVPTLYLFTPYPAIPRSRYPSLFTPLPPCPLPLSLTPLPLASPLACLLTSAAQSFCLCLNDVTDQMFLIVRVEIDKFRRNVVIDTVFQLG